MIASLARRAGQMIAALSIALALVPATAWAGTAFEVRRAISMDQWVTWPSPDRWNDADIIGNFPEWQRFVSDAELAQLKQAGLDTVRLPIDPAMFLHASDEARARQLLASIDRAIDRLRAQDLNVIVDLHTIPRGDGALAAGIDQIQSDDSLFSAYLQLTGQMAGHLSGRSTAHVALELINEPTLDCRDARENAQWHAMLKQLHTAARNTNPDITLVAPGACWGSAEGLARTDPSVLDDDSIIWSFHHYEPFKLTHQSARWAGPWTEYLSGIPYPPTLLTDAQTEDLIAENIARILDQAQRDKAAELAAGTRYDIERLRKRAELTAEMTEPFETAARWADEHGIDRAQIFIGEFGMIGQEWERDPATRPEWRVDYIRDMIALAEANGFSWALWSFGGAFGLMQGFGGEALEPPLVDAVLAPGNSG